MRRTHATLAIVAAAAFAAACSGHPERVTAEIAQRLRADHPDQTFVSRICGAASTSCGSRAGDVWKDVRAFYQARGGEPAWVNGKAPATGAQIALSAFTRASEHGFDPERYAATSLGTQASRLKDVPGPRTASAAALASFDLDLTIALLMFGRDVAIGLPGPPPTGLGNDRRRAPPDIAARLAAVLDEGDLSAWPDEVRPAHPQYAALQRMLAADPKQARAGAIIRNMERWRWMPDDFGERYVLVNIPQYQLHVYEGGRDVLDSRVIVGRRGDETPIFSATMTQVVLSPYWNIPDSIAEGETVPMIVRNPGYLSKSNIEVLRRSGDGVERVDPASVDWNNAAETSGLSLRQKPGPGNALGHIKFLLPNRFNVYLHDTPTHNLFDKAGRAFSHGCIRVEQPIELAKYVLADFPEWTEDKIREAMNSGTEKAVKLTRTLPVHLVYFTVWVDSTGTPQFLNDVYGLDR